METKNFPAPFWYSVSVCLIVISTGLTWSAIRSGDVRLEVANAKLTLSGKISETQKQLDTALQQLEEQSLAYQQLKQKYDLLAQKSTSVKALKPQIEQVSPTAIESVKENLKDTSRDLDKINQKLIEAN